MRSLRGRVAVLMYHRVLTPDDVVRGRIQPGMYVLADVFRMHMAYVARTFEVLSLAEALARWEAGSLDPRRRYCVITIDDGWVDTYRHAFPILKSYGLPATVFLATDFVGTSRWFWTDRLAALLDRYADPDAPAVAREAVGDVLRRHDLMAPRNGGLPDLDLLIETCKGRPPERVEALLEELERPIGGLGELPRAFVDWDEVREMSRHGISFGPHAASHAILPFLDRAAVRREVETSTEALARPGVSRVDVFCYPNGGYNDMVIEEVRRAGYRAAVTTDFGVEGLTPEDPFRLRRVGLHNDISFTHALFAVRVAGFR